MMLLAHVFVVPVEEVLLPLAGGFGVATVMWWKIRLDRYCRR